MTQGIKKAGFAQGLYETSATKKEEIGTKRITKDGRVFRYAKAGATALVAGQAQAAAVVADAVTSQALPTTAIGATSLVYTAGSSVTYGADYFAGGFLQINDATGEGHQYLISSSSAVTSGTTIYITLEDPIRVALVTTSEGTLVHSPFMATVATTTPASLPVGIAPVPVTAAYYYWSQTRGPAVYLSNSTPAIGSFLVLTSVSGALGAASSTIATTIVNPIVGYAMGRVGVDTEFKPIFLTID